MSDSRGNKEADSDEEIAETLLLWEAPALLKAKANSSEKMVAIFLQSKGIPIEIATAKAEELVKRARKQNNKFLIPRKIIGWTFVLIAVLGIAGPLIFGGDIYYILGSFFLLGMWILYGMNPENRIY